MFQEPYLRRLFRTLLVAMTRPRNRTGDSGFTKYLTGDWRLIYTTGTKKTEDAACRDMLAALCCSGSAGVLLITLCHATKLSQDLWIQHFKRKKFNVVSGSSVVLGLGTATRLVVTMRLFQSRLRRIRGSQQSCLFSLSSSWTIYDSAFLGRNVSHVLRDFAAAL